MNRKTDYDIRFALLEYVGLERNFFKVIIFF